MNPARESVATETFGPYEVYERLGMGGMASVHRAKKRGPAGFERTVALKRMLAHLTEDRGFIESFVREAKVASLLVHPNIAQVYDFGRIGGVFYIAMEMVAGFDLRKMLRHAHKTGEAIPMGVVLTVLAELCDALDYAHSFVDENGQHLNIVHRDISPSNIIIAHTGHVKVIDFGIAKASSRQLHTETGMVKGKLGYMAPEAAMGLSVSAQSDMFSIGVTAWELVTALPLFSSRTDFETMRKLREEAVPRPSQNNPACPQRLDRLILSALAREPEQRITSARAFRNELDVIAQECNIQLSARAVANWTQRLAESEGTARASSTSGASPIHSSSGRQLPLPPEPETQVSRPRSGTQPQTLRRSDEDLALATEIWGEDNGTQGNEPAGADFSSMGSVVPIAAPGINPQNARVTTGPDVQVPHLSGGFHSQPSYSQSYPSQPSQVSGGYAQPGTHSYPPGAYPPSAVMPAPEAKKSRAPLFILAMLAIVAGVLGALLYLKRSEPKQTGAPQVGLKFNIEPQGAIVEIAGKQIGSGSPVETHVVPGVYSISVRNEGYKTWTTSLAVRDGEDQTINIALEHDDKVVAMTATQQTPPPPQNGSATVTSPFVDNPPTQTPTHKDPTTHHHHETTHTGHVTTAPEPPDTTVTTEPPKQDPPKQDPPKQDPPKQDPPKQDPPKQDPIVVDTKPKTTPVVAANAVTKVSGDVPVLHGASEGTGDVLAKMCIDESGRVSSVQIKKSPPEISSDLQRALTAWRYKPYMKGDKAAAVCFPLQLRVVLKN